MLSRVYYTAVSVLHGGGEREDWNVLLHRIRQLIASRNTLHNYILLTHSTLCKSLLRPIE